MIQENVTMDDALKMMEEGQMPNSQAPTMPPRVIGIYMYMYHHIIPCMQSDVNTSYMYNVYTCIIHTV